MRLSCTAICAGSVSVYHNCNCNCNFVTHLVLLLTHKAYKYCTEKLGRIICARPGNRTRSNNKKIRKELTRNSYIMRQTLILALMVAICFGAAPHVDQLISSVHFEHLGTVAGMATHGMVTFDIEIGGFVKALAEQCRKLQNVHVGKHGTQDTLLGARTMRQAMASRCLSVSQKLTQILSSWIPEEDLHNHPHLQLDLPIFDKEHQSAAAPLDSKSGPLGAFDERLQRDRSRVPGYYDSTDSYEDYDDDHYKDYDFTVAYGNTNKVDPGLLKDQAAADPAGVVTAPTPTTVVRAGHGRTEIRRGGLVRNKRFFGAGLLLGTLGTAALTGAFGGLFHSGATEAEVKHVAEETNHVLGLEEAEIQALNRTLGYTTDLLKTSDKALQYFLALEALGWQANNYFEQVEQLTDGLVHLLHRSLSPGLVRPDALRKGFEEVKARMKIMGAVPLVDNHLSLYTLSVSHTFNAEQLTFKVEVLVPGEMINTRMELWKFVPFPLQTLKEPPLFVVPEMDHHYIGVRRNEAEEEEYRVMTTDEIITCQMVESVRVCKIGNIFHRSSRAICIEQLFTMDLSQPGLLSKHCNFKSATQQDFLVQVDDDLFHLYLSESQDIDIQCAGEQPIRQVPRQGLLRVRLPAGCRATTKAFSFQPEAGVRKANVTVVTGQVHLEEVIPKENLTLWHTLENTRMMTGNGMTVDEARHELEETSASLEEHSTLYYLGLAGIGLGGVAILAFVISRAVRCTIWEKTTASRTPENLKMKPRIKRRIVRAKGTDTSSIEMNEQEESEGEM